MNDCRNYSEAERKAAARLLTAKKEAESDGTSPEAERQISRLLIADFVAESMSLAIHGEPPPKRCPECQLVVRWIGGVYICYEHIPYKAWTADQVEMAMNWHGHDKWHEDNPQGRCLFPLMHSAKVQD